MLLVPDAHGGAADRSAADPDGPSAVAGPARPWLDVRRVVRPRPAGPRAGDVDATTPRSTSPPGPRRRPEAALADLRDRVLAPLATLRPAPGEKLAETLRAWLLYQGRRDDIAAALFVHPQTVRYRMGQLRELYGDRLDDPATIRDLTLALA